MYAENTVIHEFPTMASPWRCGTPGVSIEALHTALPQDLTMKLSKQTQENLDPIRVTLLCLGMCPPAPPPACLERSQRAPQTALCWALRGSPDRGQGRLLKLEVN